MRKIITISLTFVITLNCLSQEITLLKCQDWARQNHPLLKQSGVIDKIASLRTQSVTSSNLPQIDLTGRAQYQSEVTKIAIPVPGIQLQELSKDQYKLYIDIKQKIYDFGATSQRKNIEESDKRVSQQQLETDLYKVRESVNSLYFQGLVLQENEKIIQLKAEQLDARIKVVESSVRNGIAQANDLDNLKAERILTEQQQIELKSGKKSIFDILALITGQNIGDESLLTLPLSDASAAQSAIHRPELKLFEEQKLKLDANSNGIGNNHRPLLFAYGQAGYGRPGLNMLNNNFKEWYLVGVGLSWNLFDGNRTKHDKQLFQTQKLMVDIQKENFERTIKQAEIQEKNQSEKLKQLLVADQKLLVLKESIAKRSASALDNGTITSADYVRDLNAALQAKINLTIHQIQQVQSIENMNIIRGNSSINE